MTHFAGLDEKKSLNFLDPLTDEFLKNI
jgi:hypothetical protein